MNQMDQAAVGEATPLQLEGINRHTRRPLSREEVYVFSLILCDNDIDRDGERFPRASLEALKEMFLGKTGIFDHSPTAQNQSARIFDTALEELPGQTDGEGRCQLRAWAYMLRTDKNRELIAEIDGGIKKEVSVGCAVARILCSICGADQKTQPCEHQKGKRYADALCCHRLEEPTDAYEWSFVAVPAQKNAGVTKATRQPGAFGTGEADLAKLFAPNRGEVTLSAGELAVLQGQYKALQARARAGDAHLETLRGDAVRLLCLTRPELSGPLAGEIVKGLEPPALEELCKRLAPAAAQALPSPQLAPAGEIKNEGKSPFVI